MEEGGLEGMAGVRRTDGGGGLRRAGRRGGARATGRGWRRQTVEAGASGRKNGATGEEEERRQVRRKNDGG
jgi:hypothetical protein